MAKQRKRVFKVWVWNGDPADELRRYGNLILYAKSSRAGMRPATLTLSPKPRKRKVKS